MNENNTHARKTLSKQPVCYINMIGDRRCVLGYGER